MGAGSEGVARTPLPSAGGIPRPPQAKPPFTLADLKKAIPPHCFQRSLLRSSAYLALDLGIAALLFYSTRYFGHPALPQPLSQWLLWPLYIVVQGWVCTGLWVIAHECGHGAFSDYPMVNDSVGMVLHSWLLVPYFSWKYSHRRHHSNTGSETRDEVFVPRRKEQLESWHEVVMQHSLGRVGHLLVTFSMGWYLYLFLNATGSPKYERHVDHFWPWSDIFNKRERPWVVVSDLGLVAVLWMLHSAAQAHGLLWLLKVYVGPLMVVNFYLVLITFLQHTHPSLPHFDDAEWDWLRGALSTIDRDYGFLNTVFHHIADTHVVHHIFSGMPHYHAQEATEAVKPVLGEYYKFDPTPIAQAVWRDHGECVYIRPDAAGPPGVLWFTKKFRAD